MWNEQPPKLFQSSRDAFDHKKTVNVKRRLTRVHQAYNFCFLRIGKISTIPDSQLLGNNGLAKLAPSNQVKMTQWLQRNQ